MSKSTMNERIRSHFKVRRRSTLRANLDLIYVSEEMCSIDFKEEFLTKRSLFRNT